MSNAVNQTNGIERRIGPDERPITLTEATKVLRTVNGKRPAICTLWGSLRRSGIAGKLRQDYHCDVRQLARQLRNWW